MKSGRRMVQFQRGVLHGWRAVLSLALLAATVSGQDFSLVPGVVISYEPAPAIPGGSADMFVGSPSITKMPNGDFIASHDLFGSGTNADTTKVFRSTDQGVTWAHQATIAEAFWSTIFENNGELYLWGYTGGAGTDLVIRQSTDSGVTWTSPVSIMAGPFGGTPNVPAIHNGRIWISNSTRTMSAPVGSNLMSASSWNIGNGPSTAGQPFGDDFRFITEGQIVASPETGVVILPKVKDLPYTALIEINEINGNAIFTASAEDAFPSLPGGEKKFGVQYDSVSETFYALTNAILPAHANANPKPSEIRNSATVLSSRDLINWDVEKIFLYSPNTDNGFFGEAFQYMNFLVDGNDLAVVSRTAYDVGDGEPKPPKGHDANLMTFHRIEDFRNMKAEHVLVADTFNDRVLRFEANDTNHLAPLGEFALGPTFGGIPLTRPMGLTQSANGDVFIAEHTNTGRVLRFDASGNFLNVVATGGTDFTGRPEALDIGPDGNLYLSVAFGSNSDKIYRIDTESGVTTAFIESNFTGGSLNNPRGITFASDGNLYVADRDNNVIRKFDGTSGEFIEDVNVSTDPQAITWDEENSRLLYSQLPVASDSSISSLLLGGSPGTVYSGSDIGQALGIALVDGRVFWTDFDNGKIYVSTDESLNKKVESVSSGLAFPSHLLAVSQPSEGESTWVGTNSNDWSDPLNWYYWGRADTGDDIAVFGSAADVASSINIGKTFTMKGMRFRNSNSYSIVGSGDISLRADSGNSRIEVQLGDHDLSVDLQIHNDTTAIVDEGASFLVHASIDLNGNILAIEGAGDFIIDGDFAMQGGSLSIDEQSTLTFASGANVTLDGTLRLAIAQPLALEVDDSFTLLNGVEFLGGETFSDILLPEISTGLFWDTSSLYANGSVSISTTFASDFDLDGDVDSVDLSMWNAGYGMAANAERSDGDSDGDGDVDGADFLAWQREFIGSVSELLASENIQTVPEPSAALMSFLALAMNYVCRPYRKQLNRKTAPGKK